MSLSFFFQPLFRIFNQTHHYLLFKNCKSFTVSLFFLCGWNPKIHIYFKTTWLKQGSLSACLSFGPKNTFWWRDLAIFENKTLKRKLMFAFRPKPCWIPPPPLIHSLYSYSRQSCYLGEAELISNKSLRPEIYFKWNWTISTLRRQSNKYY